MKNNLFKIDEIHFNRMKIVSDMLGNYNLGIIFDNNIISSNNCIVID